MARLQKLRCRRAQVSETPDPVRLDLKRDHMANGTRIARGGASSDGGGSKPDSEGGFGHDFVINLMEHLVVPVFVLNAKCEVIIWNRACQRLTGVPASEVLGTSEHWRGFYDEPRPTLADLVCQGRADEVVHLYAQHDEFAEGRHGLSAENWCDMPRVGSRFYLAIDAGPIYDSHGSIIAVVETVRDMTVQKRAQIALQHLAARDGLTGLANRRSFDETLHAEWRRTVRESQGIAILMIDVDNFKAFNDRHGHLAGDDCLRHIAAAMQAEIMRGGDLVARFGGEEFAVILPNLDIEGARVVAERMRSSVERLGRDLSANCPGVTVSIGVAAAIDSISPVPSGLLAAADAALYEAKNGRNRVVAHMASADLPDEAIFPSLARK
ncbi:MAG: diguanylate cyclase [Herminiimonas sp.]|nr:diguanylate cyclase [Herminiimonas sp.]MDB5854877.1 diguanylate cyclase [Herminiimonas sp.]